MRLRPPNLADAEAVLRVLQARDIADLGAPDFTLEDLLDQWRGRDFALQSDSVLAVGAGGEVIGYAVLWGPGVLAAVDPAHEGHGAGSALLAWVEERARQTGRTVHRQWVNGPNSSAHELLRRAGYHHVRSYWRMVRDLDTGVREPEPPPGVTFAPVDRELDARALYEANGAAFAANPDYEPETFSAFCEEHLAAHDFDATLSRVARRDGRVAGFALCRRWTQQGAGFIDLLGVDPSERRRGVASALLLSAFAAFAAAGLEEAQLGVASDNPRALALYERVGMAPRNHADVFEKPVRVPGSTNAAR